MIRNDTKTHSCTCQSHVAVSHKIDQQEASALVEHPPRAKKVAGFARATGSILISFLYAFFPKCPICWAAWMSVFGSFGLSKIPYQPWLLPVMCLLLLFHLAMLVRGVRQKGYGPFAISLGGAAILLAARYWDAGDFILYVGMACIGLGAFWNSFSMNPQRDSWLPNFLLFRKIFKA